MSDSQSIIELQTQLFIAFNSGDLDKVMSFFAEDCVFETAAGSESCGTRVQGIAQIRNAFAAVYENFPDVQWKNAKHSSFGDSGGVSEWTFTATQKDGQRIEANGVDLFSIAHGKITKKNAFRKDRPLLAPLTD